ncbi:MAG: secondary thiamine-phosphate synthase enzyme YjbQ [Planctomycetota bacterium]
MIRTQTFRVRTRGHTDILDITSRVADAVHGRGIATVFVSGSTAGITTIEYEPGLLQDLKDAFEKIAPERDAYHHHATGDDNGSAHVRAALLGPSVTIPFADGRLLLGPWQQIVLVDFDTRPREREITVQVISDEP